MKYCLLVPHYDHAEQLRGFLPQLLATDLPCIIVDDGSGADQLRRVKGLVDSQADAYLVDHRKNRGKGAAVKTGLAFARTLGFTHAIQVDADGQHTAADIPRFVDASKAAPRSIICGRPVFDQSVPKVRLYGRKVTDFWVMVETLSRKIKDGLCGFRVYPLDEAEAILDRYFIGVKMDFDTEILVKAVWLNVELVFLDTAVVYPRESVSHFNYLRDNLILVRLHTRLLAGMVARFPLLLLRRFRGPRR